MIRLILEAVKEWVLELLNDFVKKGNANDSKSITGRYNVLDFGLKNNGAFDNTLAFRNMLATVENGATIFFPQGTYKFTDSITINKGVTICGVSKFLQIHSTINVGHAQSEIYFAPTVANKSLFVRDTAEGVSISNLTFQCNSYKLEINSPSNFNGTLPFHIFNPTITLEGINAIDDSSQKGGDFIVRDSVFRGYSGNAVTIVEHHYVKNCGFLMCGNAVKTLGTDNFIAGCWFCSGDNAIVGECVKHPTFTNIGVSDCWCDQMTGHFIRIVGEPSIQSVLIVDNVWIDSLEKSAIYSDGELKNCMINGRFSRCGMMYAGLTDSARTTEIKPMCDVIVAKKIYDSDINITVNKRAIDKEGWGNPNGICPSRVVSSIDEHRLVYNSRIVCADTLLADIVESNVGATNLVLVAKDSSLIRHGAHIYNEMPVYIRQGTPLNTISAPRQNCLCLNSLNGEMYRSTGTTTSSWERFEIKNLSSPRVTEVNKMKTKPDVMSEIQTEIADTNSDYIMKLKDVITDTNFYLAVSNGRLIAVSESEINDMVNPN